MELDKTVPMSPRSAPSPQQYSHEGYSIPRGTLSEDIQKLRNSARMSTSSQQSVPSVVIERASVDHPPLTPQSSRISLPQPTPTLILPHFSCKDESDLLEKQFSQPQKTHYRSMFIAITFTVTIIALVALILLLLFY